MPKIHNLSDLDTIAGEFIQVRSAKEFDFHGRRVIATFHSDDSVSFHEERKHQKFTTTMQSLLNYAVECEVIRERRARDEVRRLKKAGRG